MPNERAVPRKAALVVAALDKPAMRIDLLEEPDEHAGIQGHIPSIAIVGILVPPVPRYPPRTSRDNNAPFGCVSFQMDRLLALQLYLRELRRTQPSKTQVEFPSVSARRRRCSVRPERMHHEAIGTMRVQKIRGADVFPTHDMAHTRERGLQPLRVGRRGGKQAALGPPRFHGFRMQQHLDDGRGEDCRSAPDAGS